MARIRSIKPDYWASQKVARVSRDARLVFIGLWNEADDYGRLVDSAKRLAGVLFPHDDDVSSADMRGWLDELERAHLIQRYEADGHACIHVCGFEKHQKVDRRAASRLPPPPTDVPPTPAEMLAEPAEKLGLDLGSRIVGSRIAEIVAAVPADSSPRVFDPEAPEPLGPYGEVMPKEPEKILGHMHRGEPLRARWRERFKDLPPDRIAHELEAALAYRAQLQGVRRRAWYWPDGFVTKFDDWLRRAVERQRTAKPNNRDPTAGVDPNEIGRRNIERTRQRYLELAREKQEQEGHDA